MEAESLEDVAVHPGEPDAVPGPDAVRTEPWPRRVRAVLDHEVVVDTTGARAAVRGAPPAGLVLPGGGRAPGPARAVDQAHRLPREGHGHVLAPPGR